MYLSWYVCVYIYIYTTPHTETDYEGAVSQLGCVCVCIYTQPHTQDRLYVCMYTQPHTQD